MGKPAASFSLLPEAALCCRKPLAADLRPGAGAVPPVPLLPVHRGQSLCYRFTDGRPQAWCGPLCALRTGGQQLGKTHDLEHGAEVF